MRVMQLQPRDRSRPAAEANVSIGLTAVVAAVTDEEPRILVVRQPASRDALPAGPLEPHHRTLDAGLRAWVEAQTE
jgi:hypothetical protein